MKIHIIMNPWILNAALRIYSGHLYAVRDVHCRFVTKGAEIQHF